MPIPKLTNTVAAWGSTTETAIYQECVVLVGRRADSAATDVPRILFITCCRHFGFSIEQVRVLVGLSINPDQDCGEVRDIARSNLDELRETLTELHALERGLCRASSPIATPSVPADAGAIV